MLSCVHWMCASQHKEVRVYTEKSMHKQICTYVHTLSGVLSGSTLKNPFLSNWNLSKILAERTDTSTTAFDRTVRESYNYIEKQKTTDFIKNVLWFQT